MLVALVANTNYRMGWNDDLEQARQRRKELHRPRDFYYLERDRRIIRLDNVRLRILPRPYSIPRGIDGRNGNDNDGIRHSRQDYKDWRYRGDGIVDALPSKTLVDDSFCRTK